MPTEDRQWIGDPPKSSKKKCQVININDGGMVKTIKGSTRPERLRFLQLITSTSNIRYTLGTEPAS